MTARTIRITPMTAAAQAGYEFETNPHLCSSPMWFAHQAGCAISRHGVTKPVKARMSKGYSVRVETVAGAEFRVTFSKDLNTTTVERL